MFFQTCKENNLIARNKDYMLDGLIIFFNILKEFFMVLQFALFKLNLINPWKQKLFKCNLFF